MIFVHFWGVTGHAARMEEVRRPFNILTGTPTGKRPLGRPRRRWENNIRMDLKEESINTTNWVDSTQDRDYWRALVIAALNLWVPYDIEFFWRHIKCTRLCRKSTFFEFQD